MRPHSAIISVRATLNMSRECFDQWDKWLYDQGLVLDWESTSDFYMVFKRQR